MRRLALAAAFIGFAAMPALSFAQQDAGGPPPGPGGPEMGPPPMDGGPGMPPPGAKHGGWKHDAGMRMAELLNQFYAANTTHNGHLTLAQAKAAHLQPVAEHFSEIDVNHHGYVTFYDIEAWHLDNMARHLQMMAQKLRAEDK